MLTNTGFTVNKNGNALPIRFLLDEKQLVQRYILDHINRGVLYEKELSDLLMQVLNPGDSFVDVGANVGYFTILASKLVGSRGRVVAIEPETANFGYLQSNILHNGAANITSFNMAAGAEVKAAKLFFNSDNDGGHAMWNPAAHSLNCKSRGATIEQDVMLTTLDAILEHETLPRIKVMKIDTEGYEHHVLMGASETIRRHAIPFISAEMNRLGLRQSGSREELLRMYMHELGYHTYRYWCADGKISFRALLPDQYEFRENDELISNLIFSRDETIAAHGFELMTN